MKINVKNVMIMGNNYRRVPPLQLYLVNTWS